MSKTKRRNGAKRCQHHVCRPCKPKNGVKTRRRKQQPVQSTCKKTKSHTPSRDFTVKQQCKFSKLIQQSLDPSPCLPLNYSCRNNRKQGKQSRNVASDPRELATDRHMSKMSNLINQHLSLSKKGVRYQREVDNIQKRITEITGRIKKLMLLKRSAKLTPRELKTYDYLKKQRKHLIQRIMKAKRLVASTVSKAKEIQLAIKESNKKFHVPYPSDL